jgi:hypothetical protein
LCYYEQLLGKFQELFNKLTTNEEPYNVIAVDGTYNNTNFKNNKKLETTLNMGYYNVTKQIPIYIDLKNYSDKNKEICSFKHYISEKKINIKNPIFVMDRAYYCYDLFNYLNDKKYKYVIRIKNNTKHKFSNKIRYVEYNTVITETKLDKNKKERKINKQLTCKIATNLDDTYTDDQIKEIYKSRWDVEVYFKLIKNNFRFSYLTEHNKKTRECYTKTYIIILINCILERLLEIINGEAHQTNNKYNAKYNKTHLILGLKKVIINMLHSNVTSNMINNILISYIKIIHNELYIKYFHMRCVLYVIISYRIIIVKKLIKN